MTISVSMLLASVLILSAADSSSLGPVPMFGWDFSGHSGKTTIPAVHSGPALELKGDLAVHKGPYGEALIGEGMTGRGLVYPDIAASKKHLPVESFSVAAWVAIESPGEWGGVIGVLQDNGGYEKGWLLGSRRDRFAFALSSVGADDGDGLMTYLSSAKAITPQRWTHVVGTYDGKTMRIYVDGKLEGSSNAQSGPILYPESAPFVVGCYLDDNEAFPHAGWLAQVRVFDQALNKDQIVALAKERSDLRSAPPLMLPYRLVVAPYLQGSTQKSMTIRWETSRPGAGVVEFGTTADLGQTVASSGPARMHEVTLRGLDPETNYFYRVRSLADEGEFVESSLLTFQTAVRPDGAFAFVVMGDTQNNPKMTATISELAFGHRPNFIVHCGDLVGTGSIKREWVHEFFAGAKEILGRYPIYPTLGNHERDAKLYYDYFSLPDPEYYYDFRYGNAHFFGLDTNRPVDKSTEQHRWFRKAASRSDATWKFVIHHQPAYTSDSNDYGNTWKLGKTGQGDPRVREHLVEVYEELGIDVVFNGHIHLYERTWPVRRGEVDRKNGVIYITTGGAGGHLEEFAPQRTWFNAAKFLGHHFCLVAIHEETFELKAFDERGRLFDLLSIEK